MTTFRGAMIAQALARLQIFATKAFGNSCGHAQFRGVIANPGERPDDSNTVGARRTAVKLRAWRQNSWQRRKFGVKMQFRPHVITNSLKTDQRPRMFACRLIHTA